MIDVGALRLAAEALVEHACGYDAGRSKDDPVYVEVTEHRDGPGPVQRKGYSSCGDLGHWLLWRLGVREPWVNRAENGGWRVGQNISLLCGPAGAVRGNTPGGFLVNGREPAHSPDWTPGVGDILIIANAWPSGSDAHCLVALERGAGVLRTANYGVGGMSPGVSPGARLGSAAFRFDGKLWRYGLRAVRHVLSLDDVAKIVKSPPDLSGAILAGEVFDALGVTP